MYALREIIIVNLDIVVGLGLLREVRVGLLVRVNFGLGIQDKAKIKKV